MQETNTQRQIRREIFKYIEENCLDKILEELYPWEILNDERVVNKICQKVSEGLLYQGRHELLNRITDKIADSIYSKDVDGIVKKIIDRCSIKLLKEVKLKVVVCNK